MIGFDDKIYIGRMLRPIKEDTKFRLTGMNFKLSAGYLYLKNLYYCGSASFILHKQPLTQAYVTR